MKNPTFRIFIHNIIICAALQATSAHAQFMWSERIASTASWPDGIPNTGLALDTNDNCYVAGFFDDTNNFGGITLTNQSIGGSDIFVAKYNSTGALQWVQRAGGSTGNFNTGRAIGVDTNGNIYVTGDYGGAAKIGGVTLPSTSGEEFYLAKYSNAGTVQWVQVCTNGSSSVDGLGLTVDGAGNSYALVCVDYLGGAGGTATFGSINVNIPANGGTTVMILVKYDTTGAAKWAELFDSSQETYATKLAVDASGNVYVRGLFEVNMTVGTSNLVVSPANETQNMFIAKFNNSGALTWVQQPTGGDAGEGGVSVDPAGNVYVSGYFDTNLVFGGGITLTNMANANSLFGDAFLAKYNSSGAIQWAQAAGGTNGGFYWDLSLDAQTNIYAGGFVGYNATAAKYNPAGTLQWSVSASGPPASPVASGYGNCVVDSIGNCFLGGFYQGTNTFGATTLQPQETYNFLIAELGPSNTVANPTVQFTASPTNGVAPLPVQFNSPNTDSLGNPITNWNWSFGDGGTSTAQDPLYIYTTSGTFTPTLVATNNNGATVIGSGPQIIISMDTSSTNYTFTTNDDGITLTITGYTGTNAVVDIPATIDGMAVADIGEYAFAYNYDNLDSVTIPDTVTSIEDGAFYACNGLTNVTIPDSVTTIGGDAFGNCGLTSVAIPESVTNMGAVFIGSPLTAITVDDLNPAYSSLDGVLFDKYQTVLIEYPGGKTGSYTIPSSVTNIEYTAFYYCFNLTGVTIPDSVTSIGDNAFFSCSSLASSITIPASVTSIGQTVFAGCPVPAFIVDGLNTNYSSLNGVLFNLNQTVLIEYPGGKTGIYTIPSSVTGIGDYAFYACNSLTGIIIPDSVTSVGNEEFGECFNLASVILPSGVNNIGQSEFQDCRSLSSITIPNNVTSIGDYAFYDCPSLTNIAIPNGVNSIGYAAFMDNRLTTVTIPDSVTSLGDYAFAYSSSLTGAYFEGNAPYDDGTVFYSDNNATVFYLTGTSGWGPTFGSVPTALWSPANPTNLVLNGDFEFGNFAGWITNGNFTSCEITTKGAYVHSGLYGASLGPVGSLGYISQTLPTTAGANYLLSLWLDSPDGETPNEFQVFWNGNKLFDETNIPAIGWTNLQFKVSATGAGTVLQFGFRDDPSYLGLDDISAALVPARFGAIQVSGSNLLLNGLNGVSEGTYYVLMSTNLALPFSQWTPVATNVLSASGTFTITVTNTVTSGMRQRFYILKAQ